MGQNSLRQTFETCKENGQKAMQFAPAATLGALGAICCFIAGQSSDPGGSAFYVAMGAAYLSFGGYLAYGVGKPEEVAETAPAQNTPAPAPAQNI